RDFAGAVVHSVETDGHEWDTPRAGHHTVNGHGPILVSSGVVFELGDGRVPHGQRTGREPGREHHDNDEAAHQSEHRSGHWASLPGCEPPERLVRVLPPIRGELTAETRMAARNLPELRRDAAMPAPA